MRYWVAYDGKNKDGNEIVVRYVTDDNLKKLENLIDLENNLKKKFNADFLRITNFIKLDD